MNFNLTLENDGNGTTTPTGIVSVGGGVATPISATPNQGFIFDHWNCAGDTTFEPDQLTASVNVVLDADDTVTAYFTPLMFSLTVQNSSGGTTIPSGTQSVQAYIATSISATPSA